MYLFNWGQELTTTAVHAPLSGWIFLCIAGILAGFVNVLAGGGSLFSLTALLLIGVPVHFAIATYRFACVLLTCAGLTRYRQKGIRKHGEGWYISIIASCGALVGANLVIAVDPKLLNQLVLTLMVILSFFLLFRLRKPKENVDKEMTSLKRYLSYPVAFILGIYGGFFGIAVSMFFVSLLIFLRGEPLLRALALNQVIVFSLSTVATLFFAWKGIIFYQFGLFVGVSMGLGAFLGVATAVRVKESKLRMIFFALLALMIGRLVLKM